MISRLACVALVALFGSASRNMSSATFAATSLFARSDVEVLAVAEAAGASVHEAARLNLPMFHNCIGKMGELRFTLGKEWTVVLLAPVALHFHVALNEVVLLDVGSFAGTYRKVHVSPHPHAYRGAHNVIKPFPRLATPVKDCNAC